MTTPVLDQITVLENASTTSGEHLEDLDKYSNCDIPDLVYSIIGSVGILDNSFVLFVIYTSKPMRERLTNIYIIHQSFVDLLASVFLIATIHDCRVDDRAFGGIGGELYCRLWKNKLLMWVLAMVSTYNLVAITIDRYLEVLHPIWHKTFLTKNKIYISCLIAWLIGAGFQVPSGILSSGLVEGQCFIWDLFPNAALANVCAVTEWVLTFPLPLIIMCFCYTRMAIAFRTRVEPSTKSMSKADKERHARQAKIRWNIFTTLVTVAVFFVICLAWIKTWYLIKTAGMPLSRESTDYYIGVYLIMMNSIVNPVIYIAR